MKFTIWSAGCDHTMTDMQKGHYPLYEACKDAEEVGFDIMCYGNDFEGQALPSDETGPYYRNSIESGFVNHRLWHVYGLPANHNRTDAPGLASLSHFEKWHDPLGKHPETSGMINAMRPFPVEGREDLYSFLVGNIRVFMLGDVNRPLTPLRADGNGDPGGVVLPETYERWKQEVSEAHERGEMVFVWSHYGLKDTVTGTGEYEGGVLYPDGSYDGIYHGAGRDNGKTSAYLAYVGEDEGRPFIEWMEQNPGKVNVWTNFHEHVYSGLRIGGKGHFEFKAGCQFIQGGHLSKYHGGPGVHPNPKSRFFVLEHGSDQMEVFAYMHSAASAPGLPSYEKGRRPSRVIQLPRPFEVY